MTSDEWGVMSWVAALLIIIFALVWVYVRVIL